MTLRIRQNLHVTETDYGMVLLDGQSGEFWGLNATGVVVVRALLAGGGTAAATAALTGEFAVDEATAAEDVRSLVAELSRADLVQDA